MRRESIVAPFFWPLEKVATFEIVAGTLCHFSVVNHSSFSWSSKFFLSFLVFYFFFSNRSYVCLRQMNKFNQQTSFWICKAARFCILKWVPKAVQLIRIPAHKCIRAIYMSHLEEQSRSKAHSCSRLWERELEILWEWSCDHRENSRMLSTYLFRIKWVVNCLGNSRQEIDGRSCGLFLQTSVCSFTRHTRYEQRTTNSFFYYRGKLADKHWCFMDNNANIIIPNPVSVSYHSLATQFNMLSVSLCLVWN